MNRALFLTIAMSLSSLSYGACQNGSYEIGDTETYINIHLACNAMTGDSNSVIWMYTKCSLSGNDPDSYTCSRLEGTDSFVVRAK